MRPTEQGPMKISPFHLLAGAAVGGVTACARLATRPTTPPTTPQTTDPSSPWRIDGAESFDLKIPHQFFASKHRTNPEETVCHTQGLALTRDHVVISCTLFNKDRKAETAQSYLLTGSREAVLSPNPKDPHWKLIETTDQPPTMIGSKKPAPLGHPSGLAPFLPFRNLVFANSTYGPEGYSQFRLFDPQTMSLRQLLTPIPEHLGAVAPLLGRYLVGLTWNSEAFLVVDSKTGSWKKYPNNLVEHVDYQECEAVNDRTLLCTGNTRMPSTSPEYYFGRGHFIEVSGDDLNSFEFRLKNLLYAKGPMGRGVRWGNRNLGTILLKNPFASPNRYGDYQTPETLTFEGMAIDREERFIYFLPADIPGGKLIRYRLNDSHDI